MALWQPTDLGAALIAWWSADGLADGAVTTWTDSVGGLAPTQGTASRRPVRAATSFNAAYAGVTFDGSDDRLLISSLGSLPTGTAGSDIYALVSQDAAGATTGAKSILGYGAQSSPNGRLLQRMSVTSTNRLRVNDVSATTITDTAFDFSGNHIVGGRFDGENAYGFFDGRATTPASVAMAFNTGTTSTCIGATVSGASLWWTGVIRHIFVTTPLSTENRQKLEGWMAWDVNLASLLDAGHPYKSAAPVGAITGALAATETGSDTAAISGTVAVGGTLAVAETGADTAAFTGSLEAGGITGTLAAVETGIDSAAIAGTVSVAGSLATTESGEDIAAILAGVLVSGTLAAIESGDDIAVFTLAHRELEANQTLVGSRAVAASLQGRRSASVVLRGGM